LSFANPHELRGFRDRPTGRVGAAIREFIAATDWGPHVPIYMTPSTYWRYRILFPENLCAQLRVAAAEEAPDWWRKVTPDIAARYAALPGPESGYLLVTPVQLAGAAESWDYGVGLPAGELAAWQNRPPSLVAARDPNRKLYVAPDANSVHESVALLFGPQSLHRQQIANISTAPGNQR
jgi:hypothetical protein